MHVAIDTSVYRADPKRIKKGFKAITHLAVARRIQIHLPYYVRHEFLTQQTECLSKRFRTMAKAASSVSRLTAHNSTIDVINQMLGKIEKLIDGAAATASEELDSWIANTYTKTYQFDDCHGKRVTDAYFSGGEPFSSAKHREDFPDAFIYESIRDIAGKHETLHMIVADRTFRTFCGRLEGVRTYGSTDEFIQLPECQTLLRNLDEIANIDRIRDRLPRDLRILEDNLEREIIEPLADTTVRGPIPDDNNEASVSMVGSPRHTQFKFDDMEYYGEGVIGIPVSTVVECELNYYIFKADWCVMDDVAISRISVSDWNKHYFLAEETRDVDVEGRLIVQLRLDELQRDDLTDDDLSTLINDANCTVEVEDATVDDVASVD